MKILIELLHLGEEDEASLKIAEAEEASSDNIKTKKGMTKAWLNLVTIQIKVIEGVIAVIVENWVNLKMYVLKRREMSYENKDKRHRGNYDGRGKVVDENNDDEHDAVFMVASTSCNQKSSSIWYLDSGTTKHMTSRKEWFSKLVECANESIALGDNKVYKAKGIGCILMKMANK